MTENELFINKGLQFENAVSLYSPVRKTAELFPKHTALRFMGKNISYATLDKKVTKLAANLLKLGLEKGEAVTFALPNIPESVYLLYAAADSGLKCSPLHPLSTPEAVCSAMKKSGSKIAFVLSDNAQKIAEKCDFAKIIAVNPANSLILGKRLYSIKNPQPREGGNLHRFSSFEKQPESIVLPQKSISCPACENTDVLLQSGGTTGTPKVIGLSANSINNLAKKGLWILGIEKGTDSGMLSVLPVFHGFGLAMGVHAMLCHGGKNVLFPKFRRASAIKEIKRGNVQFVIGVPRLYEALLSHPDFNGKMLRSLSVAFVGGDFVPRTLLENFDRHIKSNGGTCRLFEGYGLTETVTVCSVNTYKDNRGETVGKPLLGLEIEAFDFSAEPPAPLPRGEKGELSVSGDTLMEEYVADADATEKVFFTHGGKKFVKTGDCGYVDSDGFVHFVSRYKRIIKVKGIPVYPMEIEQLVCAMPEIRGACAVPLSNNGGEQKIILFAESDNPALGEQIRSNIREKISVYAEPHDIVFVKEFPRTDVSKIDTKILLANYSNKKI